VEHKPPETAWLGAPKAADEISVAPGSQERVFLDEEESDHPTDSQTVKRVPSSSATNSHQTVVDGSPTESREFRELNSAIMESLNPLNNSLTLSKRS
jgi:hypothetical protein